MKRLNIPRKRRLSPEDAFFYDGNVERERLSKIRYVRIAPQFETPPHTFDRSRSVTYLESKDKMMSKKENMFIFVCNVSGCKQKLKSVAEFSTHYEQTHRNACTSCGASYPTSRLLDIHIRESHDAFFRVLCERKPMYECLVEGCEEKFSDNKTRRSHLISVHHYPSSFRFHNANRRSLLKKQKKKQKFRKKKQRNRKKKKDIVKDQDDQDNKMDVDNLADQLERVVRIPKNLSFGRRRGRRRRHHR